MTRFHALIIDDDPKNLKVLNQMLARQGVTATEVSDPATLSTVVPGLNPVDVVFLDLEMPSMNGYDAQKYLRQALPNARIIACTVHNNAMADTERIGFDGFIAKPLDISRFPDQLARILSGEPVWDRL